MKNTILGFITIIAALIWCVTAMLFDSEIYFGQIMLAHVLSGLWLASHLYINRFYYWKEWCNYRWNKRPKTYK